MKTNDFSVRGALGFISSLWRRQFVRNVTVVAGGTAIAQVITVAASPVITRLYGPEALGVMGVFGSVVAIIVPVATLCYPLAIVLPRQDNDAIRLLYLSITFGLITAGLVTLVIVLFGPVLSGAIGLDALGWFILLIPPMLIFAVVSDGIGQWLIRVKSFAAKARVQVIAAVSLTSGKLAMGLVAPGAITLVILSAAGAGLTTFLLYFASRKTWRDVVDAVSTRVSLRDEKTRSLMREYADYPMYRAPSVLVRTITSNLPVILLASFSGPAAAGFYAIGHRVLTLPISLVSQAVGQVFQQRIAEAAHRNENLRYLLIKATLGLATIGLIPFATVAVLGPSLFSFVFGSEWLIAGEYARWLSLWIYFIFIVQPIVVTIPVIGLQGHLLLYQLASSLLRSGILILGLLLQKNDVVAVALFSITGVLHYVIMIFYVVSQSRHRRRSYSTDAPEVDAQSEPSDI